MADSHTSMCSYTDGSNEDKANLHTEPIQGAWRRLQVSLVTNVWWISCCCWYPRREPFDITSHNRTDHRAAHRKARSCPAQLKVSTVDKRTIEVKITYAENAAMATQLYEVDVFMFFLKDLEAVSTNFYHDLWQSTRLHTPKIPLAAMVDEGASDGFANMVKDHLLVIQEKQLLGKPDDAAVQQDIDKAIDTVVQQLRLQGCMFRQSVRQAMKGIAGELEAMQRKAVTSTATCKITARIGRIVQLISEVMQKVHLLYRPLESSEAPEAVREVWMMVDEYMLTEAEVSFIKLLETLDQTALRMSCSAHAVTGPGQQPLAAAAAAMAGDQQYQSACGQSKTFCEEHVQECAIADITIAAPEDCRSKGHETAAASNSSSALNSEDASGGQQPATLVHASSTELVFQVKKGCKKAGCGTKKCCEQAAALDQSQSQGQKPDTVPFRSASLASNKASSHMLRSNSASDRDPMPLQTHSSSTAMLKNISSDKSDSSTGPAFSDAAEACRSKDALEDASGQDSKQKWPAAACNLLCGDPQAAIQDMGTSEADSSMDTVTGSCDEQQEAGFANVQMVIKAGREVQGPNVNSGCAVEFLQDVTGPQSESLQALATARQLIVDGAENLQAAMRTRSYFESMIHDDDSYHNEVYTNRIKGLKNNARAAVVLKHQSLQQSFLLADVVGASVAGLAMCLAVGGVYLCYRFSRYQLNPLYVLITVIAYMMKDRMKEWGKRYLEPVCVKFGFEFPDRIVKVRDSRGRRVGRCKEWAKVVGDDQVDAAVLAMRHKNEPYVPKVQQATKPERVMTYRKKMEVNWDRLDPRLQCVDGLDDIMRFDLQHFCRRMQPPQEPHYRMSTDPRGRRYAEQVHCARVYHINIVLRIRTSTQDKGQGCHGPRWHQET
ncbi:hypothetical protein ABBQ32_004870 [Trebouxia sp. C0010 RCD-2024]